MAVPAFKALADRVHVALLDSKVSLQTVAVPAVIVTVPKGVSPGVLDLTKTVSFTVPSLPKAAVVVDSVRFVEDPARATVTALCVLVEAPSPAVPE